MFEKEQILNNLKTTKFGKTIFSFDSIDSTNNFCKSLTKDDGPHGTIIITEEQTAGRGRLQRSWDSPKGKNLLFSIVLYPEFDSRKIALLPFAGSLAVADAIEFVTELVPTCKWPNDVLINGKKVCGMLLETSSGNTKPTKIILGIGVNVNQDEFPETLQQKASSLKIECGIDIDRVLLLQKIVEEFEHRYEQLSNFAPRQILHDWKMKALLFGKQITVSESEVSFTATAIDVAEDGSLLIETDNGQRRNLFAGDVQVANRVPLES